MVDRLTLSSIPKLRTKELTLPAIPKNCWSTEDIITELFGDWKSPILTPQNKEVTTKSQSGEFKLKEVIKVKIAIAIKAAIRLFFMKLSLSYFLQVTDEW